MKRTTLVIISAILLMGMSFAIAWQTTPDEHYKAVQRGLWKVWHGQLITPLMPASDAQMLYSAWFGNVRPPPLCIAATENDWLSYCQNLWNEGMHIDCWNANPVSKAEIMSRLRTCEYY